MKCITSLAQCSIHTSYYFLKLRITFGKEMETGGKRRKDEDTRESFRMKHSDRWRRVKIMEVVPDGLCFFRKVGRKVICSE